MAWVVGSEGPRKLEAGINEFAGPMLNLRSLLLTPSAKSQNWAFHFVHQFTRVAKES